MITDSMRFESEEMRELARQHGAVRVEIQPGVWIWQVLVPPSWACPSCGLGPQQIGCPYVMLPHGLFPGGKGIEP